MCRLDSTYSVLIKTNRPSITLMPFSALCTLTIFFFFNDTATTEIYTLSLHDALPIWSVAVADFNRDGIQDLAVATYLGPTVSILLGNGNGTFQPKPSLSPNSGRPASVVAGDFNGDGVMDLAVANYRSTTVSVFVGNGDGTFQPAVDFGAGNGPFAVAMADLNGDLVQDLITANYDSTNISVLLGTTRAAAVTLVPLAVSPPSVIGGNSATGTVTLSGPAPAGGAQ